MESPLLLSELRDGILWLTINRPQSLNALNSNLLSEIDQAVSDAHQRSDIGGIILTGSGEKAFAAGADISEFADYTPEQGVQLSAEGHRIFNQMEDGPKPVIAAVNGFALGGGCELAMACHIRIASENARFGQPEVNLGTIPGYGGTQRLAELVGKGRALELLLTGNMIDAAEAYRIGLVNQVVPLSELHAAAEKMLRTIMSKGPLAVARSIELVNAKYRTQTQVGAAYSMECDAFGDMMSTADFLEGTTAFLEKRKAQFTGE
jgi:enoyl-CoA hydratase